MFSIVGVSIALIFAVLLTNLMPRVYSIPHERQKDKIVTFPDPHLEAVVREAIGKATGNIYRSDIERLRILSAPERGISDLTNLEYFINLTGLGLGGNRISDISPLSNLTNLTGLDLGGNRISDISPLSNLTNLNRLWLHTNKISDLSLLSNLTNLTELRLHRNQISDLSPLVANEGLSKGDSIDLRWNPLNDESLNTYIPQLEARGVTVSH